MARVSIYVSDDQKTEMDKLEHQANWSSAAQAAFAQEIKRLKWPKETNMASTIERLRKSKQTYEQDQKQRGLEDGREWAMERATFENLKSFSRLNRDNFSKASLKEGDLWLQVNYSLGHDAPNPDDPGWFWDEDKNEGKPDDYVDAFIEGAQQVWKEVSEKL